MRRVIGGAACTAHATSSPPPTLCAAIPLGVCHIRWRSHAHRYVCRVICAAACALSSRERRLYAARRVYYDSRLRRMFEYSTSITSNRLPNAVLAPMITRAPAKRNQPYHQTIATLAGYTMVSRAEMTIRYQCEVRGALAHDSSSSPCR